MAIALGSIAKDLIAFLGAERLGHAARHQPARMDALSAEQLNDPLADLAQGDAVARQLRICRQHAEQVALAWIAIHAQSRSGAER